MVRKTLLAGAAALALAASAGAVSAASVMFPIDGTLGGSAFSGEVTLNVVGGQAQSGGGTFSFLSLSNTPLVLITTATPGDETGGGPGAPVGFRGNDGTDYFGLDTAYPIDTNGLLFDVGTNTADFGHYPLLALYSNGNGTYGASFTGQVGGVEHYNISGPLSVPEPATWAVMLTGFGAVGAAMRSRRKAQAATA